VDRILKKKPSSLDSYIINLEEFIFRKRNYKKVIAVSKLVKRQLIECFNVPEKDIEVVYNGINLDEFRSDKNKRYRTRKQYNVEDNELMLLFVSNDFKNKGLDVLISSLSHVRGKKVKLFVVGNDREGVKPAKYLKLAEALGVQDMITFTGLLPNVHEMFNAADIFALPTDIDSFGLVELEAIASGLPVIVSPPEVNGFAEIITDGKEGFILKDRKNSRQIAEYIAFLSCKPDVRKAMSDSAKRTAQDYSWRKISERTLEVYRSTL
jgi:UDP-glucose:(heptosyl)LPS alpha-1,3-glucosyltransferase